MSESDLVKRARELLAPWEGRCLWCGWTLGDSCTSARCCYVGGDRPQRQQIAPSLLAALVEAIEAAEAEGARLREALDALYMCTMGDSHMVSSQRLNAAMKLGERVHDEKRSEEGPDNADG